MVCLENYKCGQMVRPELSQGHQYRDPSDVTLRRLSFITLKEVGNHWGTLSRRGKSFNQPFLSCLPPLQALGKNKRLCPKLHSVWGMALWHSSDLSSVRRNLTGKASSKDFDFLMSSLPWLALLLPLPPFLNLGMMSGAVPAILRPWGKCQHYPKYTSNDTVEKPAASLDLLL